MHFKGSNIFPILLRQNRNCVGGADYQVVPRFSQWSLSKGVFERRTSTGSEVFFILKHLDAPKFVFLSVLTIIETSCPKRWAVQKWKKTTSGCPLTCVAQKRLCLDAAFFWLGAACIRGRRLLVILLPSAAFNRINTVSMERQRLHTYISNCLN